MRCLSVVVPCYNEAATIKEVLARVLDSAFTAEIIVVDDGSTDETVSIVGSLSDPRIRLLQESRNTGKGAALRRGFREAKADFVVVQDADLEYDHADFGVLLEPLLAGKADVVFGSRFV